MQRFVLVSLAGMLCSAGAWAQDDAPGRGVARLSLINGELSVKRGDSGDLVAAAINAPLLAGDRVLSGVASRGEIQLDWANFLRLGARSEVRLADLENQRYLLQIAEGAVMFRTLRDGEAQVELSTPSVSVRPLRRGSYRVEVLPDGTTEVTVRDGGRAEIFTPRGTETIRDGHTLRARGSASDPEYQVVRAQGEDEFDRWNNNRDRDLNRSQSYRYVPRGVYGVDDLDLHGSWFNDPGYGWVWSPRVAAGWAPYRFGRWGWLDYYGWSWISHDPWGWAPFHYGRWFHGPRGWCWWPGAAGVRTWWRPGLVAFFGFGGGGIGFNAGIGFGGGWNRWGWVPLAPFETFHPWYGNGFYRGFNNRNFINNTTIVNNTNVYNIYRNARVDRAITAVDSSQFGRGRGGWNGGGGDYRHVTRGEIENVNLVRGQLPVSPGRDALRFGDRDVTPGNVPRSRDDTRFYSRTQPTNVERVPFERQQETLRAFEGGRGAGGGRVGERPAGENPVPGSRRGDLGDAGRGGGGAAAGDNSWRRAGEGRGAGNEGRRTAEPAPPQGRESGEWSRFGDARTGNATRGEMGGGGGRGRNPETALPATGGGASTPDNGWRRTGEGRDTGRGTGESRRFGEPIAPANRESEVRGSGDWRRFGEAGPGNATRGEMGGSGRGQAGPPPVPPDTGGRRGDAGIAGAGAAAGRRDDSFQQRFENDWRRFEGGSRSGQGSGNSDVRSEPRSGGGGFGRGAASGRDDGGYRGGSPSEPVRISPPIVRDRGGFDRGGYERRESAPRMESPRGNWGGGGGSGNSAPRMESPRGNWGGGGGRMEGPSRGGGGESRGSVGGGGGGRGGDQGRSGGRRGQ